MKLQLCIFLFIAIILASVFPARSWTLFDPDNQEDCVLKYQKLAKCERAAVIINNACKCKFEFCDSMNSSLADCLLSNIPDAQTGAAATSIYNACKHQLDSKLKQSGKMTDEEFQNFMKYGPSTK